MLAPLAFVLAQTKPTAVPEIHTSAGAWSGGGFPPLRVATKIRAIGSNWAFDLESKTPHAYDWKRAYAVAVSKNGPTIATNIAARPDGRHVVIVVPRDASTVPPDRLRLGVTVPGARQVRMAQIEFRWER